MSREFPDFIDPWRLADGGKSIGGTIPLARLKRLQPLLESQKGEAVFKLQFAYDEQRRATVKVEVSAPLTLICQRSLEPFTQNVHQHSLLQIIADAGEQANLSDQEEFVLVQEGRLAVADLVEDELILAVPQIPRNPEFEEVLKDRVDAGDVAEDVGGEQQPTGHSADENAEGRQRPFESLAELMKNQ
jgi:uncharacterized protein